MLKKLISLMALFFACILLNSCAIYQNLVGAAWWEENNNSDLPTNNEESYPKGEAALIGSWEGDLWRYPDMATKYVLSFAPDGRVGVEQLVGDAWEYNEGVWWVDGDRVHISEWDDNSWNASFDRTAEGLVIYDSSDNGNGGVLTLCTEAAESRPRLYANTHDPTGSWEIGAFGISSYSTINFLSDGTLTGDLSEINRFVGDYYAGVNGWRLQRETAHSLPRLQLLVNGNPVRNESIYNTDNSALYLQVVHTYYPTDEGWSETVSWGGGRYNSKETISQQIEIPYIDWDTVKYAYIETGTMQTQFTPEITPAPTYESEGEASSTQIPTPVTFSYSNLKAPTGQLPQGKTFDVGGTIIDSSVSITDVTVGIYFASGEDTSYVSHVSPNSKSYTISNDVNKAMMFGKLLPGSYVYCITVTAGGSTGDVVDSYFTIISNQESYKAIMNPTDITFAPAQVGYGKQNSRQFSITNSGTGKIKNLIASLNGSKEFEISTKLSRTSIAKNSTATISVRPKKGLAIGTHAGTLTIKGNDGVNVSADLVFVVNAMPVTSIALNETAISISIGTTHQLTVIFTPSNAADNSVTWSSSNPSVATVSTSGLVTAQAYGTTTIAATAIAQPNKYSTCIVTVEKSAFENQPPSISTAKWLWPVPSYRKIYSPYVYEIPALKGKRSGDNHTGLDIGCIKSAFSNEKVVASRQGTVVAVKKYGSNTTKSKAKNLNEGGCAVVLAHTLSDGIVYSLYLHLKSGSPGKYDNSGNRISDLNVGDEIYAGEQIGITGYTGLAYSDHLHFALGKSYKVNKTTGEPTVMTTINSNPVDTITSNNGHYSDSEIRSQTTDKPGTTYVFSAESL